MNQNASKQPSNIVMVRLFYEQQYQAFRSEFDSCKRHFGENEALCTLWDEMCAAMKLSKQSKDSDEKYIEYIRACAAWSLYTKLCCPFWESETFYMRARVCKD